MKPLILSLLLCTEVCDGIKRKNFKVKTHNMEERIITAHNYSVSGGCVDFYVSSQKTATFCGYDIQVREDIKAEQQ